jgi:hypothetical protein
MDYQRRERLCVDMPAFASDGATTFAEIAGEA